MTGTVYNLPVIQDFRKASTPWSLQSFLSWLDGHWNGTSGGSPTGLEGWNPKKECHIRLEGS